MLAYCLFFAAVCLNWKSITAFNSTDVQIPQREDDQDCSCGPHGKCSIVERAKICECETGFAVLSGNCLEIPFPSWQVWQVKDSHITFHVFPTNKSREIRVLAMQLEYRNLNSAFPSSGLATGFQDYYLDARLDSRLPYEFRFRLISNMESNAWTGWGPQPEVGPPDRLQEAPTILEPKNNTRLKLGNVRVSWKAASGNRYGVRLVGKYPHSEYLMPLNTTYFQHVDNMIYYNTSFNLEYYPILPCFIYHIDIIAINDYGPSPIEGVQFEVENKSCKEDSKVESFPWWLVAVVSGNVFLLALIALCCYCVQNRRSS